MKTIISKKLLSSLLALALVISLISGIPVSAAGTVTVTAPTTVNSGNLSTYQNAVLTTNGVAVPEDTFLIFDGVTATVVLENFQVKVDAPAGHEVQSGIELKNGANVTLILRGENITWGSLGGAGIYVPGGCKLTISAESTGSIDARGGNLYGGGTGIGASGNHYNPAYAEVSVQPVSCGDIRIEGGTVTAVGGNMDYFGVSYGSSAAIGGSWGSTGGTVTITGGTVNATGGKNSPGIGAANSGDLDSVTITGGTVNSSTTGTLTGGAVAAGLGSGLNTNLRVSQGLKNLTITGGKVNVYGKLGYSPVFNSAKPNLECNVQLREGLDLTVSHGIDPLGNMLYPTWNLRLEDLSNVQAGTGKLLVTDSEGNKIVERDVALNNTATGVLTGSTATLLNATRQGTSGKLTLTVNGKSYEQQIVFGDSQTVTFGPGMGTAELVFVSDYLMQDISNLTLTVRDLATGQTLEDRLVAGDRVIRKTAATRGLMVLQLTPGRYSVTVTTATLNDGQPITGEITVERGGITNVELLRQIGVTTVQELVLDNGNIVFGLEDGVPVLTYFDDTKTQQKVYNYTAEREYTIVQKAAEAIGNTVTVSHGDVKLKLQGVNISAYAPVSVTGGAKLRLNLAGENTLVGTGAPAIYVAAGTELTLEGSGSVNATGKNGAGIGGKNEENSGTITINGGTIVAKGDRFGPGIGTGKNATGGKLTINGGNITATSGNQAAGIGSGYGGFCVIEITGGTVNATSTEWAAAIGGAQKSKVDITISGGTVTAQAGKRGAGIGSGYEGDTGTVTITGGTVIAKAYGEQGDEGAGIGGGCGSKLMIVTITDGTVEAYGGDAASGIGSGDTPIAPAKVYIRGGNIKAYGRQRYAAGIGGGGNGAVVEISGGTVYAEAWNYAAGIGGGNQNHAGTILISGGDVTVVGPAWDAAGIGSYISTVGGSITISGGNVQVNNRNASGAPGIGGVDTLLISGGTVTAIGATDAAGIGGARNKRTGNITITGGIVNATSRSGAAAIGAGSKGQLETITISGGHITTTADYSGAGIGGGWKSTGGTILISGGTIVANGSPNAAGIGGGYNNSGAMEIVITGGNIKATGGSDMPAIGAGQDPIDPVTLSNGTENGSQTLRLVTVTLEPAENGEKILSAVGLPGYYGLKDVQTLDTNKLYLYLPADANPTQFETEDNLYNGSISGNTGHYVGHIHSWSYAASGTTITATCTAEGSCKLDNQGGSITLTVPGEVSYTGKPYQAVVDNQLKTGATPSYVYLDDQGQPMTDLPVAAGSYTVKLTVGDVSVSDSFTIAPCQLTEGDVTLQEIEFTYDGTEKVPTVLATANDAALEAGTDYTVSYENNTAAGQATVTVTGMGNYAGTVQKHFTIQKAALTQVAVSQDGKLTYNGQAQTPAVTTAATALNGQPVSFTYSTEENGSYSQMPTFMDAGTYTVYCLVTAPNHESVKTSFTVTVDKAENSWLAQPAISGWTYGEEAKAPVGQARFGTAQITYTGTANDGTAYTGAAAPTKAGSYTVTFTVADTENYSGMTAEAAFTVAKASYDLTGAKWDYTAAFRYDAKEKTVSVIGLPEGITVAGYEGNTATVVGDYLAKVTLTYDKDNYETPVIPELSWRIENNWEPTEFTVTAPNENGWYNTPVTLTPAQGYLVSQGNTLEAECLEEMVFTAEGKDLPICFYLWDQTTGFISLEKVLSYSLDQTVPTGKVELVERKSWESFLSTITFGLFYKEEVTLRIEAADTLSGVDKIEYAAAGQALNLEQVQALEGWTEYTDSFSIPVEDAKQFVYFVRITDKAGNVTYLSTDGAEYDTSAPVISGAEDGKTYYVTQTVTVTDRNLSSVTLNGQTVTGPVTLEGNREASYILVATDKAGNTTTVTVKMLPIDRLTQPMEKLTEKNVTSAQEKTLRSVKTTLEEQLKSAALTAEEKTQLEKGKTQVQKLLQVIDKIADARKQAENEKKKYTSETVTSDHTQALKDLAEDVQKLLDTNNLTKSERSGLEAMAQDIQALQLVIEKTGKELEQVKAQLEKLEPETVTSEDAAAVEEALSKAQQLLEGQNLTQQERNAMEEAKETAEKLLEAIDKAEQAANTESAQAAQDIHADNVKPDQQTTLEAAKTDLEKALAENGGNYTDEEKQTIQDTLDRIEKALDSLERIGQTEALLTALPGTADRKTQEQTQAALTAAEAACQALTDHERSQLSSQATGQLEATRQALEALARTQKTTRTVLWIAIPGAVVIFLIVLLLLKRKKKEK